MKVNFTWRIWLLIIVLILSLFSIFGLPPLALEKGVVVKSVDDNSTAFNHGLRQGAIITSLDNQPVDSLEDYSRIMTSLFSSSGEEVKVVLGTKEQQFVFFTDTIPEITVANIPNTNIKTGLDLQGGARALVVPEQELTDEELNDLIAISNERFNVYGISDVQIRPVRDLSGNNFMLVEIAGATPNDLESLVGQQGKFEARIGNETAFVGGNNDITHVCRNDATCSGIESCGQFEGGFVCSYSFTIFLSPEAAQRHADITNSLSLNASNPLYLDETIEFYVDDQLANSLLIHEGLRGQPTTQIQISGSGQGFDQQSAIEAAEQDMKSMQTILITGSIPYKLEIAKLDTISPLIGQKFNNFILLTGIVALSAVALIVLFRYRDLKASIALLFTSFSELFILLGVAAAINWNLDLPSIVGILITIGTGVDQQIVILDESKSKKSESMRQKIKNALFIVFAAYATTVFALLPLWRAGAGLLRGFAVTTIIGLTIGVLITRPAFADMIKSLDKKNVS